MVPGISVWSSISVIARTRNHRNRLAADPRIPAESRQEGSLSFWMLVEGPLTRRPFGQILGRIERLAWHPIRSSRTVRGGSENGERGHWVDTADPNQMKLVFELQPALPKLAWIATVDSERQTAVVTHGPWVEVLDVGFIEGIWDGPFADPTFDQSPIVFGSGAIVRDQSITFVSSTSTTDYLYWQASDDRNRVTASNSLALLLAVLGDELDPQVGEYDLINNSIMSGINRYVRRLPTKSGTVNRLMHWNLTVTPGRASERGKPLPPEFATFNDYFTYLSGCYGRLARNARDSNRSRPMAIFSTQSRGYDTTAANAVAKEHGIEKVFTVAKGKAKGYFADEDKGIESDDDGTDICHVFGLTSVPIDRRALEYDAQTEYLFYASLHDTGDFNLQQIDAHILRPTVLITGCFGGIRRAITWNAPAW